MKSCIFYAMNEISDVYIIEAAKCIEKSEKGVSASEKCRRWSVSALNKRVWRPRLAVVMAVIISFFAMMGIVQTAAGRTVMPWLYELFGVELVTNENKDLIGKKIIDRSVPEVLSDENTSGSNEITDEAVIPENHVIDRFANDDFLLPFSISEIEVIHGVTPEIILTNGSMAVFYQNNYEGWNCKPGDTLTFSFEKYESEATHAQTLLIGYIRDGIVYEGEIFKEINGCYKLQIREEGEYHLYVISATSDYLTLKQGTIRNDRS